MLDEGVHRKKVFGAHCKKSQGCFIIKGFFFHIKGGQIHPPILVKRWKTKLLFHGRLILSEELVNLKSKTTTNPKKTNDFP